MTFYELVLLIHISGVIVWLGSALLLQVLAHRTQRTSDLVGLGSLMRQTEWLSNHLFIPSSLVVLAAGVVLTIDGPWSFGDVWIVIALAGFAIGFVTGAAILGPAAQRAGEQMAAAGGVTEAVAVDIRRFLLLARIDFLVLVVILVAMVLKPTGDDPGVLIAMAVLFAAGVAYLGSQARGLRPVAAAPDAA